MRRKRAKLRSRKSKLSSTLRTCAYRCLHSSPCLQLRPRRRRVEKEALAKEREARSVDAKWLCEGPWGNLQFTSLGIFRRKRRKRKPSWRMGCKPRCPYDVFALVMQEDRVADRIAEEDRRCIHHSQGKICNEARSENARRRKPLGPQGARVICR